jgi:hypothetical protein
VLHWGACLQQLDTKVKGTDITVILKPELSNEVFPITATEAKAEKENIALRRNEEALKQQLTNTLPDRTTPQEQIKLEQDLGAELVQEIKAGHYQLPAGEFTDEQDKELRALAQKYNVLPGKVLRYVKTFIKQPK